MNITIKKLLLTVWVLFAAGTLLAQSNADSINVLQPKKTQFDRGLPHNIIEVGGGPVFMYPNYWKWLADEIADSHMSYHNVVNWKVSYSHPFANGLGIGINYTGIRADYDGGYENKSGNLSMNYFAPTFNGHWMIKKWMLKFEVGAGCKIYDDSYNKSSYFAINENMGVGYKLSKHFGLFLECGSISAFSNEELLRDFPFLLTGGFSCYF
jgi:hypothetical protein